MAVSLTGRPDRGKKRIKSKESKSESPKATMVPPKECIRSRGDRSRRAPTARPPPGQGPAPVPGMADVRSQDFPP